MKKPPREDDEHDFDFTGLEEYMNPEPPKAPTLYKKETRDGRVVVTRTRPLTPEERWWMQQIRELRAERDLYRSFVVGDYEKRKAIGEKKQGVNSAEDEHTQWTADALKLKKGDKNLSASDIAKRLAERYQSERWLVEENIRSWRTIMNVISPHLHPPKSSR
ncbi:MAG: hypothetical protein U9Q81_15020 [Pseudomonadota bacterium]|nr:hypothetical protein [Pseudomonadota bacterium]